LKQQQGGEVGEHSDVAASYQGQWISQCAWLGKGRENEKVGGAGQQGMEEKVRGRWKRRGLSRGRCLWLIVNDNSSRGQRKVIKAQGMVFGNNGSVRGSRGGQRGTMIKQGKAGKRGTGRNWNSG